MSDTQPTSEEIVKVGCVHPGCKSRGTYIVGASCTNCGWSGRLEIVKGHEFNRWTPCPRCDCTYTLMKNIP